MIADDDDDDALDLDLGLVVSVGGGCLVSSISFSVSS